MAVITVANLIPRVRRILNSEPWEDFITADPGSGGTTVAVNQPQGWAEGDLMEFSDGEVAKVRQTGIAGASITVKRGHAGTTAAAHTASGATAVILKNPEYPYQHVSDALNRTVEALFPYVWKRASTTITASASSNAIALTVTDFVDLVSVNQKLSSTDTVLYGLKGQGLPVQVERWHNTYNTTGSAQGIILKFPHGFKSTSSTTIDVTYRALLTNADIEETNGIADLVTWGAAARLVGYGDIHRMSSDVSQGDASVEPGKHAEVGDYYRQQFEQRRREIFSWLMLTAPPAVAFPEMTDITDPYSVAILAQAQSGQEEGAA